MWDKHVLTARLHTRPTNLFSIIFPMTVLCWALPCERNCSPPSALLPVPHVAAQCLRGLPSCSPLPRVPKSDLDASRHPATAPGPQQQRHTDTRARLQMLGPKLAPSMMGKRPAPLCSHEDCHRQKPWHCPAASADTRCFASANDATAAKAKTCPIKQQ